MTIPAFRYVDGVLVPCENYGNNARFWSAVPPPINALDRWARHERRRLARAASGPGRRRARRVSVWKPVRPIDEQIETLTGHRLGDRHGREALLYLPAGESLTAQHLADVTRAYRAGEAS